MKRILLTIYLLLLSFIGVAQNRTITGKIVNDKNTPLSEVSVIVEGTKRGTNSDPNGEFSLQLKASDRYIIFSYVGYKTLRKKITDTNFSTIILQKTTQQLDEVIVTSTGKKSPVNKLNIKSIENPTFISAVTSKVLELRNVTKIEDALKNITGAQATSRYGGFMSFSIRGFSFSDHALLVDGVRDERISMSWAPVSNLSNVERIEVLKGPESVLAGHSVLGGIISITRKQPSFKQKINAKFSYGSYNSYATTIGVGGPINNKLRYRFDFGSTKSKGWRENSQNTNNGSLLLDFTPDDKNYLQFSVQANDDFYATETGLPTKSEKLGDVELIDGINIETRYNDPEDKINHKRKDFSLKYRHTFNKNSKLSNSLSYSDDDIFYISNDGMVTVNDNKTKVNRLTLAFKHHAKPLINQLDYTYKFNVNNLEQKILIGNYYSHLDRRTHRYKYDGPGVKSELNLHNPIVNQGYRKLTKNKIQIKKEQVIGFFIQNYLSFSDKLKMLLGVRFDNFDINYKTDNYDNKGNVTSTSTQGKDAFNKFTYRTGLVYTPTKKSSIFASYSTYFRPSRKFDANNKTLDPEGGYQTELGIKYQPNKKFQGSIAGFYIIKDNILERTKDKTYKKLGQAESKGFEIDLDYTPIKNLYLKAGYAYIDATIKKSTKKDPITQKSVIGNRLRYSTNHLFNFYMNYEPINNLKIGLGANYTGNSATYSSSAYQIPSYTLVDASIHYTFKNVQFGVNVNNLFNEFYFSSSVSNWATNPPAVMATPGIKRNYTLSISYNL